MSSTPKSKRTGSTSKQQEKAHLQSSPHDDHKTQTSCKLSSEPAIQRMQRDWFYCKKPSQNKTKRLQLLKEK